MNINFKFRDPVALIAESTKRYGFILEIYPESQTALVKTNDDRQVIHRFDELDWIEGDDRNFKNDYPY